jgi:hypothetical protein
MPPSAPDPQANSPHSTAPQAAENPALHESSNYRKGIQVAFLLGLLLGLLVAGGSLLFVRRP